MTSSERDGPSLEALAESFRRLRLFLAVMLLREFCLPRAMVAECKDSGYSGVCSVVNVARFLWEEKIASFFMSKTLCPKIAIGKLARNINES